MTKRWTLATAMISGGCIIGPGVIGETATDGSSDGGGVTIASAAYGGSGDASSSAVSVADSGDTTAGDATDGTCVGACDDVAVTCRSSTNWTNAIGIERAADDTVVLALQPNQGAPMLVRLGDDGDIATVLGDASGYLRAFSIGTGGEIALLYLPTEGEPGDGYVVERRDASNNVQWSQLVTANEGNPDGPFLEGHDVGVDGLGNVYVVGVLYGDRIPPIIPFDEIVDAYDADGSTSWRWTEDGSGLGYGRILAPVEDGRVLAWFSIMTGDNLGYRGRGVLGGITDGSYSFHDPMGVEGLIAPLVQSTAGWHGVRNVEGGLAISHFDDEFEFLSVRYDVPNVGPLPRPVGVVPHRDGVVVLLSYADAPELGLELRSYDADGAVRWSVTEPEYTAAYAFDHTQTSDGGVALLGGYAVDSEQGQASFVCTIAP